MARGFYYAGAHSLLYSLWNVSDKPTSELMQHFYSGVWKHERLSAALREAKLGLVKNPKTAYPMCWAGFILLGR
jgi:CHAT domain-containing protein